MEFEFQQDYTRFFDLQKAEEEVKERTRQDFTGPLYALLRRLGAGEGDSRYITRRLWQRMTEPDRRYHTAVHVLSIFANAERMRLELAEHEQLAIWFHDSIYSTLATPGYNESDSAGWMCVLLDTAQLPREVVDQAAEAIRWTARHLDASVPRRYHIIMDLDLAGLSADWPVFERQSAAVRAEMAHVSEADYCRGTMQFFQALLDRPSIYRTPPFRPVEAKARKNLLRQMDILSDMLNHEPA